MIQELSDTLEAREGQPWESVGTVGEKILVLVRLLAWKNVNLLLLAAHSEESGAKMMAKWREKEYRDDLDQAVPEGRYPRTPQLHEIMTLSLF